MESSTPAETARVVNALTEVVGEEIANVIVERLPAMPATELATKADLAATEVRLSERIEQSEQRSRASLDTGIAQLRAEMAGFRAGTAEKFEETHKRISDMALAITTQTRTIFFGMVASVLAIIGAMATLTS